MSKLLMVLEDGETFTKLEGCHIIEVPDDFDQDFVPDDKLVKATFRAEEMMIRTNDTDVLHDRMNNTIRVLIRKRL